MCKNNVYKLNVKVLYKIDRYNIAFAYLPLASVVTLIPCALANSGYK